MRKPPKNIYASKTTYDEVIKDGLERAIDVLGMNESSILRQGLVEFLVSRQCMKHPIAVKHDAKVALHKGQPAAAPQPKAV